MGMYTCLRFVGELKDEFVDEIKKLFDEKTMDEKQWPADYNPWDEFSKRHPFAKRFASLPRADFIPFGGFTYYNADKFSDSEDPDRIRFTNVLYPKTWAFQCDLKNYGEEIEAFLSEVAVEICERFVAEEWYEEDDFPKVIAYGFRPFAFQK